MRFVVHPRRIEKGQEFGVISIIQVERIPMTARVGLWFPAKCLVFSNCCHNSLDFSGTSCCKPLGIGIGQKTLTSEAFSPAGQVFPGTENILRHSKYNLLCSDEHKIRPAGRIRF
jgi:hypothetical protein